MGVRRTSRARWLGPAFLGLGAVPVLVAVAIRPDSGPREAPETSVPLATITVERDDARLSLENGVLYGDGEPFTGRVVERYPDGSVETMTLYEHGVREGTAVSFFATGALRWERTYASGREEGVHRGWYDDGKPHFWYPYADGLLEGNALEWFPDGSLYRDFNYVRGHEEGSQRMWHEDGTVRANYVVRDGRRYGLMGSKGCAGEDFASWDPAEENEP